METVSECVCLDVSKCSVAAMDKGVAQGASVYHKLEGG